MPLEVIESAMRANKWDEAIQACHDELRQHPNNARAHDYLGVCYAWKGDYANACECFRKASTLDSNFVDAGARHVQALIQLQRYEEARVIADEWKRIRPNDKKLGVLVEFLGQRTRGEFQSWERTQHVNVTVKMSEDA